MRQVLGVEYDQMLLLAPSIEEWIGPEHPARYIREFVSALNLRELKLDTLDRTEGGIAYEPALLLQAWLYGYYRKIRSCRALEQACREEMGFVWLSGNHRPDHNALWRYWNEHREGIRQLFRQSVKVAVELELVGLVVQALDGTKITAAASGRGVFDRARLEKVLARLDEQLSEREAQIEQEGPSVGEPTTRSLVRLREKVHAALERVKAGEAKHAHPLEPEAVRMECDGRNRFGYNAQAVVDTKAQIIVASEVISAAYDTEQLVPMISQAQANCAVEEATPTTLADGGYANGAQFTAAEQCGYPVVTPPPSSWSDTSDPYHIAHFRHDPQRRIVTCPQGRELPFKGVREKDGKTLEIYRNGPACKNCPVRAQCTSDPQGRAIYLGPGYAAVVLAHAQWHQAHARQLYSRRAPTVEPVFAQIKQQMGFRRWTVRGLEKVSTQWDLLATTWNLRVIFRHRSGGTTKTAGLPSPTGPRGGARAAASRPQLALALAQLIRQLFTPTAFRTVA